LEWIGMESESPLYASSAVLLMFQAGIRFTPGRPLRDPMPDG